MLAWVTGLLPLRSVGAGTSTFDGLHRDTADVPPQGVWEALGGAEDLP